MATWWMVMSEVDSKPVNRVVLSVFVWRVMGSEGNVFLKKIYHKEQL